MNAFSIIKKVTKEDLDDLDHVNNVVYVKWIQEVSKKHWEKVAQKISTKYIWVVRRHDITYLDAAKLNDEITLNTRILDSKGPISFRQVQMINNKTQKTVVKSITEWCLLNSQTLKPIRVPKTIEDSFKTT